MIGSVGEVAIHSPRDLQQPRLTAHDEILHSLFINLAFAIFVIEASTGGQARVRSANGGPYQRFRRLVDSALLDHGLLPYGCRKRRFGCRPLFVGRGHGLDKRRHCTAMRWRLVDSFPSQKIRHPRTRQSFTRAWIRRAGGVVGANQLTENRRPFALLSGR